MGAGYTPQQVLTSSTDQWMMVDKSAVSLDGTACNKVGTSYIAFQYQNVRPPSCDFNVVRCMQSQQSPIASESGLSVACRKGASNPKALAWPTSCMICIKRMCNGSLRAPHPFTLSVAGVEASLAPSRFSYLLTISVQSQKANIVASFNPPIKHLNAWIVCRKHR